MAQRCTLGTWLCAPPHSGSPGHLCPLALLPTCQGRAPISFAEGATLCAPFQPSLGTLIRRDGSIAKANPLPLLKRDHCRASERRNLIMTWQVGLTRSDCPQEPNPNPLGAATSSHQHQCHLQSPAMCLQSPKRYHQHQGRQEGSESISDIPIPRLCHALQPQALTASNGPRRQQDAHAKQEAASALLSSVMRQNPRASLLNVMASNCSLQFDSEVAWLPISVLNDMSLDSEIKHLLAIISLNRHGHL